MRDKEFLDLSQAYNQIYQKNSENISESFFEQNYTYDEVLEYLLSEGYSEDESHMIITELINEGGLGSLIKLGKGIANIVKHRASTPLKTGATDVLATALSTGGVKDASNLSKVVRSASSPTPIVRTVKPPVRTAPKASKVSSDPWKTPSASTPKPTQTPKPSTKPTTRSQNLLPQGKPGGALVSTRAPKPSFKPEALPKAIAKAEPGGALVSTRAPKPSFKPEALPKAIAKAEPGGALVSTRAPKPLDKVIPSTSTKSSGKQTLNPSGGSTGTTRSLVGLKRLGGTIAGATALGVAASQSTAPGTPDKAPKFPTTAQEVGKGQTYYDPNTRIGTSQRFAQRKKVGQAKIGSTFKDAFKFYRERGDKTFKYAGKEYTTKMKENLMYEAKDETEEGIAGLPIPKRKMGPKKRHEFEKKRREARRERNDPRTGNSFSQHRMTGSRGHGSDYENTRSIREEILVNYLLDEGFASDEKSAQAIAGAMSEDWVNSIINEDLGVAASELASKVIGKPRRTSQQVSADAARLRSATSGGLKALGGALGLGAGEKVNAQKMQSRRPKTSIQKDVAKRTSGN